MRLVSCVHAVCLLGKLRSHFAVAKFEFGKVDKLRRHRWFEKGPIGRALTTRSGVSLLSSSESAFSTGKLRPPGLPFGLKSGYCNFIQHHVWEMPLVGGTEITCRTHHWDGSAFLGAYPRDPRRFGGHLVNYVCDCYDTRIRTTHINGVRMAASKSSCTEKCRP